MKTNYFLKLSDPFKSAFYLIRTFLKREAQQTRDFHELCMCLITGNLQKFDEFFNKKYDPMSFILLVSPAVANGKLDTFLKLEEKAIKFNKIHKYYREHKKSDLNSPNFKLRYITDGDFYGTALTSTMSSDNKGVLEYLIRNKLINKNEISFEHFIEASTNNSKEVLQYLLYDLKISVNRKLKEKLKDHPEIINLIEKRDLLFQLGTDLNSTEITSKIKPNKL